MNIYTRTGDDGTTSLFSGQRVPKNNHFIEAVGTVDEANSSIGLAISYIPNDDCLVSVKQQLEIIQHALFDIGAALATPRTCHQDHKLKKTYFDAEASTSLEKWIDQMQGKLPELKTFILPGGHPAGAALHVARSHIRRAERCVIPLYQQSDVNEHVLVYLNRLSDYLFVASRFVNQCLKHVETTWSPHLQSSKKE